MFFSGFRAYRGDAVAAVAAAAAAAATHAPASGSAATLTISSQVEGDSDHSGNIAVNIGVDNSEE
ncbi:unnamed protein product, partial [Ectocarpus sp. 12 AP-2014]